MTAKNRINIIDFITDLVYFIILAIMIFVNAIIVIINLSIAIDFPYLNKDYNPILQKYWEIKQNCP